MIISQDILGVKKPAGQAGFRSFESLRGFFGGSTAATGTSAHAPALYRQILQIRFLAARHFDVGVRNIVGADRSFSTNSADSRHILIIVNLLIK